MKIAVVLMFLSSIVSCSADSVDRRPLKALNPTSYVFYASINTVRMAIVASFPSLEKRRILAYRGSEYRPLDTLTIFDQPGNEYDFYIRPQYFEYGKSRIYEMDGQPLDYVVSFHLHIERIGNDETKVSVIAINPRVVLGKELVPKGPHFVRPLKYMKVEPSTIEEYEILLEIGKSLQQTDMPEIVYPGHD